MGRVAGAGVRRVIGIGALGVLFCAAPTCVGGCGRDGRPVLPATPYRHVAIAGRSAPMYLINYDKYGRCESPLTCRQVLDVIRAARASGEPFTNVFVISHGWNNIWPWATGIYNDYFDRFAGQAGLAGPPANFKPLIVGIIWPSTVATTTAEQGPRYELTRAEVARGAPVDSQNQVLRELAEQLHRDEVVDLAAKEAAGPVKPEERRAVQAKVEETERALHQRSNNPRELAAQLAPLLGDEDGILVDPGQRETILIDAARTVERAETAAGAGGQGGGDPDRPTRPPARGGAPGEARAAEAAPAEAGGLPDPRWLLRVASVWLIKDRAAVVGRKGVSSLVDDLVAEAGAGPTRTRVHLVGHSYGAKVVSEAVAAAPNLGGNRKVDSILLLQAAMNAYSYSPRELVPRRVGDGRFHVNLGRVRQPVLGTFSEHDMPLFKLFHLFVTRASDRLELAGDRPPAEAAAPNPPALAKPPNAFAAMGGYGPQPLPESEASAANGVAWVFLRPKGTRYAIPHGARVVGLRNRVDQIQSHGDVKNDFTCWALWEQVLSSAASN